MIFLLGVASSTRMFRSLGNISFFTLQRKHTRSPILKDIDRFRNDIVISSFKGFGRISFIHLLVATFRGRSRLPGTVRLFSYPSSYYKPVQGSCNLSFAISFVVLRPSSSELSLGGPDHRQTRGATESLLLAFSAQFERV